MNKEIIFTNREELLNKTFLPLHELSLSDINQDKDIFLNWLYNGKDSITYEEMFTRLSGLDKENEATYNDKGYVVKLAEAFFAYTNEIKFILSNINLTGSNKWIPLLQQGLEVYNNQDLSFEEKLNTLYKLYSLDGEGNDPYYMFFSETPSWEGLFRNDFTNAKLKLLNFTDIGFGCGLKPSEELIKMSFSNLKMMELEMQFQKTEKHFK